MAELIGKSKEVLNELKTGRTRELLLLLQDRPVPEVLDPLPDGLNTTKDGNGDTVLLGEGSAVVDDFEDGDRTEWTDDRNGGSWSIVNSPVRSGDHALGLMFGNNAYATIYSLSGLANYPSRGDSFEFYLRFPSIQGNIYSFTYAAQSGGDRPKNARGYTITFDGSTVNIKNQESSTILDSAQYVPGTDTWFRVAVDWGIAQQIIVEDSGNGGAELSYKDDTYSSGGLHFYGNQKSGTAEVYVDDFTITNTPNTGKVRQEFTPPTTEPAAFSQWNAIRAEGVSVGGSTSTNPVEFDILDASGVTLNTTRIPKSEIADTSFVFRNREYDSTASGGQTEFTIPTTGSGGSYGIDVLNVVSVKQNGSVLDNAWSFDGVDTVTLDSSANDGDTITIRYDLDVFDDTLQPVAYLNRESTSETTPSISHFLYEYVI